MRKTETMELAYILVFSYLVPYFFILINVV